MPSPAVEPGATVGGKYRLVRRIGVGGMGEVWVATNRATGAEVAVKMARGAAVREDSALRFRHEARLGAMLAHRSVVRIFDLAEEADGTLVLVMELLRGETLERYVQRRAPLPASEAVAIVTPVLSALAHAHATGIIHRDVTPANVFLAVDPDGYVTPKLLDFGIAKAPAEGTKHTVDGRALGTPQYMAPERIREQGRIDGRSDLFSVGVVLYEMLTGDCPFLAGSPAASLAAVLEVVVDPDPRIDPRLWIELRRSLSKQPYERHATAVEMARSLLAASGETEASLTEVLRAAPLSRDLLGDDAGAPQPTRTVGGHSLGGGEALLRSRGRSFAWLAVALIACVGLATGTEWLRHRASSAAASAPPADIPTSRPGPELPPSQPLLPPPGPQPTSVSPAHSVLPSTSASSTTPSGPQLSAHPARPARPRPVATTPGF
jgi:eukaryotic-like serine/threonine-protein kinase